MAVSNRIYCALSLAFAMSLAEIEVKAEQVFGEDDMQVNAPSIAAYTQLIDSTKEIEVCDQGSCIARKSQLRINLIHADNGPSTDVSPKYSIYLTMHNEVEEHASAYSMHRVAESMSIATATRTAAGIYELQFEGFEGKSCFTPTTTLRIDARDLSIAVRQARKTSFFEDAVYADPIHVTVISESCD